MDFSALSEVPNSERNERPDRETLLPGSMGSGTPVTLGENARCCPIPVSNEIVQSDASAPTPSGGPEIIFQVMDPVQISALREQRANDLQNALRQDDIRESCKRLGVSSSGSKATTTLRVVNEMSFDVLVDQQLFIQKVINSSEEFEEEGSITRKGKRAKFSSAANLESDVSARSREQNMTQGDLARLIMVMADPLLQSEVSSMYAYLSRAQLDGDGPAGQHPFQNGSVERMFNDTYFTTETPDACSGCEQEAIDALDCAKLP
jgi:hypothetical protein